MKRIFSFFTVMIILIPLYSVFPQTLMDYVSNVKGDTLVVKDYYDMNNQQNSLYEAMTLDTGNVPAGRVYELKTNGYYPLENNPTTLRNTVIVGEDNTILVKNENSASRPPLICGTDTTEGFFNPHAAAINVTHDLTVKNCNIMELSPQGYLSYSIINTDSANLKITFDNCLVEHLIKDFLYITQPNYNVTLRNCYFVNMNGFPCRRSGGIFDSFANMDTLLVENCTHIMAQGSMYRLRGYPGFPQVSYKFKRIIFNHNTFVNCAGYTFMDPGLQNNVSLTNNIFVDCNIQGSAPFLVSQDIGEVDPDSLPMGLVNVYPDSADVANNTPRKFLCQDNLVYWDPSLANMDSILNANSVDGVTNWHSQMIIMNTRTDSMFKHEGPYNTTPYSYLVTDTWKNQMPTFTDTKDLFTTQLAKLKTYALAAVGTTSVVVLPTWRVINTGSDDYLKSDWPIPVDLSYSDADLLTAGLSGFPIGDLNWFPSQKAAWSAQRTTEYNNINNALNDGKLVTAIFNQANQPVEFQLQQNYPNPFNPSTNISFMVPKAGHVTLKVYNILGQEVATLLDGFKAAQTYNIRFDGNGLASGVYLYRLEEGNNFITRKMVLLK
jgi:hypothetical protein